MDWVLRSPLIHNTFGALGVASENSYQLGKNCNVALETILRSLITESRDTFSYRRNLSFGQNIKKDLIPALLSTKDNTTIELITKILVNLTLPLECFISVENLAKTEFGRHTIFELNNLLLAGKHAFTDPEVTRAVVFFLKQNAVIGCPASNQGKLSPKQCENINNCLLLVRNILRVSEDDHYDVPNVKKAQTHNSEQNQIIWNLFSVGFDKIVLRLMTMPEASQWCVSLTQLTALLFKEQHVLTLQKLLQAWLDASSSETSDDNESNTSPPGRSSEDSSPIHTSDSNDLSNDSTYELFQESDRNQEQKELSENLNVPEKDTKSISDDSVGNEKCNDVQINKAYKLFQEREVHPISLTPNMDIAMNIPKPLKSSVHLKKKPPPPKHNNRLIALKTTTNSFKNEVGMEPSDCGYGTQHEKGSGSVSTSSNEEEAVKPPHPKPHNKRPAPHASPHDRRRKRLVKRSKINNTTSIKKIGQSKPTDDAISQILKEFTLDFLLNGYGALVKTVHNEILVNPQLQIDSSHFFWLVTYFLKFAVYIEVDMVHLSGVLSYDVISYLVAEGVKVCEDFMLAVKLDSEELKPSVRRLHLVVTAIREFMQALQAYDQIPSEDKQKLRDLQIKMCDTVELRQLPILLIRNYNPKYHSKQYLQDLVTTNHILVLFMDKIRGMEEYKGSFNMVDHIKQFASPEMMYQYSLVLEEYTNNGEFVNDCVFTMMHHVAGPDINRLDLLFQPKILKTFSAISEAEYEVCDDWVDLIEYALNVFMKRPHVVECKAGGGAKGGEGWAHGSNADTLAVLPPIYDDDDNDQKWAEEESNMLKWNYMHNVASLDVIGDLVQNLKNEGIIKTPKAIVQELLRLNLINDSQYAHYLKPDSEMKSPKTAKNNKEIRKLCEQLIEDGKGKCLKWVQELLLDICYTHTFIAQQTQDMKQLMEENKDWKRAKANQKRADTRPVVSPVVYYNIMHDKSVPLVSWTAEQASMCRDLKFLQLVHRLGFQMPVDSGRIFVRVPLAWPASHLYRVALSIAPAPTSLVKYNFSLSDLAELQRGLDETEVLTDLRDGGGKPLHDTNFRIHRSKETNSKVQFTPQPCPLTRVDGTASLFGNASKTHWLEIIAKSKEIAIQQSLSKSVCETASVVSDLTHMYVSDEEERAPSTSAPRSSALLGLSGNLKRRLLPPSLVKCKTNCLTH